MLLGELVGQDVVGDDGEQELVGFVSSVAAVQLPAQTEMQRNEPEQILKNFLRKIRKYTLNNLDNSRSTNNTRNFTNFS